MIGDIALQASGISAARGRRSVLRDVDLTVRAGEIHALIGPNGAGKSTLLSVLAGDLPTTTGTVHLRNEHGELHPLQQMSARAQARCRTVVPQQTTVAFAFTGREIVRMGRTPWARMPGVDHEAVVDQSIRTVGAADLADRPFAQLSGGERALICMARALAQTTPVLLLDEPTAALDLHHTEEVLGIARERATAGDAVVVVLHDLLLAAAHADVVTVLRSGMIAASGPPALALTPGGLSNVYDHPVEVFPHPRTGTPMVLPIR